MQAKGSVVTEFMGDHTFYPPIREERRDGRR